MERIEDTGIIVAARLAYATPSEYRLRRGSDGEVVLQGAYRWEQGSSGGFEWRDIPTIEEE